MLRKKQKNLIEKETLLPLWLFSTAVCTVVIHNAIYAIFGVEESIFFFVSLVLILAFWISIIYDINIYLTKGQPADIWKLGFLGVFGVLSIFAPIMIIFYGFFIFFGLRK